VAYRDFREPAYVQWRRKVYVRDDFRCQYPGCTSKKGLNAHHIIPWSRAVALRYIVSNGICLCKLHHNMLTGAEAEYQSLFQQIVSDKEGHTNDPFWLEKLLEKKRQGKNGT